MNAHIFRVMFWEHWRNDFRFSNSPQFDHDNNGQIVIYTGLTEDENGKIREMTDEELEGETV